MKPISFALSCLALAGLSPAMAAPPAAAAQQAATAQQAPPAPPAEQMRAVIADLNRIVTPHGVQETFKAKIGGVEQWLYVRGQDVRNPVMLFVHGGPASPMSAAMWEFQRPLEEYFTIVQWDQRGAGRTYLNDHSKAVQDSLTIDRYVSDTLEVAQVILARYHQKKLILAGHSWGTVLGMKAALARPELFCAYVGIGQLINARASERVIFEYALSQAKKAKNQEAITQLEALAPYPGAGPIAPERAGVVHQWADTFGGFVAFRQEPMFYFEAPLLSPEYDAKSAAAIEQGMRFTMEKVLPELFKVDFSGVTRFPIPLVMFMGRHDYDTPSQLTAQWLDAVKAPYKRAVWFENSAHLVPFEEPGKTLVSLVNEVRPLAVSKGR